MRRGPAAAIADRTPEAVGRAPCRKLARRPRDRRRLEAKSPRTICLVDAHPRPQKGLRSREPPARQCACRLVAGAPRGCDDASIDVPVGVGKRAAADPNLLLALSAGLVKLGLERP